MKIKNLLLLFILLKGFSARPSFCAGEPVAHAAGREDSAALAGAGRGAGAGAADGVVGLAEAPFAPLAVGPLAKIELLRGSLAGIPQSMQGASLLHGAMLWEMGIVKMLYAMLITPIEKGGRMLPDEAICNLGAVLNELFYLAGGSLQISGMESCLAQRLNPAGFGRLYASIIYNTDIALPISKKHKSKKKELKKIFESCKVTNALNPKNLLPSIIASCFWAKYVMDDSVSVEQARENIAAFNAAAHSGAPETALSFSASAAGARAAAGDSEVGPSGDKSVRSGHNLAPLEIEMIARIQKLYQYYIPAPPKFGDAIIYGLPGDAAACCRFSDCGESALRGLLSAAFYNNKTRKIIVPDDHRYSDELRHFFKTYSSLDQQGDQEVRDVWGVLCSGRPGIVYTEINFCGMSSHFENIISLLGLLVPGALPSDCACLADVASFTDAAEAPASDDEYLSDESFDDTPKKSIHTKDCAIKILQNLCNMSENDLEVSELTFAEDGHVSWNITSAKSGEKPCWLYFNAHPDHVESELRVEIETPMGVQIQDPILGGSDVISTIPQNPDLVEPLVFAASRMAQERNLVDGYIFMHLVLHEEQNELISSNIIKWRLISSDQQGSLKREKRDYFYAALVRGYYNLVNHLLDRGAEINGLNQYGSRPLIVAARNRRLKIAQLLLDRGADINLKDRLETTALARSVEKGYLDICNLLLSRGADPRLVDGRNRTPLMIAAVRGDDQAIEILYKAAGLIDEVDNNGYTALMLAANNGYLEASQVLIAYGANVNTKNSFGQTALMGALEGGHVEVVKLLLENGALYNSDDVDKYPGFERLPDSLRARMLHK